MRFSFSECKDTKKSADSKVGRALCTHFRHAGERAFFVELKTRVFQKKSLPLLDNFAMTRRGGAPFVCPGLRIVV